MTINYLDSKRLQGLSTDVANIPLLEDTFTSNVNWTQVGTNTSISGGTANINNPASNGDYIYATLPSSLSGNFILHFDWYTTGSPRGNGENVYLSSAQEGFWVNSSATKIGFSMYNGYTYLQGWQSNGYIGYDIETPMTFTNDTWYYGTLQRVGTVYTLDFYTNSTRTTSYGNQLTFTGTANNALQYLIIGSHSDSWNKNAKVDNVKVFNTTSLTNKPTNVQTNSTFEQTDTPARYWYDGTVWKNNGSPSVSKIGVFGGSNAPNAYIANYETLNLSTNVWNSSGSLTSARARTSTGSTISDVYIIGGQNGSGYHATVEKINWSTNGMTSTSDFTYAPSHTSANAPTFCQILSYYFASYFTNSRKYTYANNSSVAGTSLSYHHVFSSAFGDKTKGIITNGNSTGANHTEMYTYASDTVTQKANPPSSSSGVSGGHSGNKTTGVQCDSTNAHLYNLSSDVWTTNGFTGMESVAGGTAVGSTNEDYYMMGTSTSVTNTKKKNYSSGVYTSLVSFANNHTIDTVSGACNDNWGVNY